MRAIKTIAAVISYTFTWWLALNPEKLVLAEYAKPVGITAGAIVWLVAIYWGIKIVREG